MLIAGKYFCAQQKFGIMRPITQWLLISTALMAGTCIQPCMASSWDEMDYEPFSNFYVSSNAADYANMATLNAEIGASLNTRLSLYFGAKYNPFQFGSGNDVKRNKQCAFNAGVRIWPWRTFSGWFFSAGAGFLRFNRSNYLGNETREGDFYGIQAGAGYAYMISRHLNLDFGVGFMLGPCRYTKYSCPHCGKVLDKGKRIHLEPNNVLVQLSYLF